MIIEERAGEGTERFRKTQKEQYFPTYRRANSELRKYFSHMLEPGLRPA